MANPLFQPVLAARCLLLNEINDIRGRLTEGGRNREERERERGPVYPFERRLSSSRIACSVYGGIYRGISRTRNVYLFEERWFPSVECRSWNIDNSPRDYDYSPGLLRDDRVHVNVHGQSFAVRVIKWRYAACVLQRGSISPADKYNRARTPQEAAHTHHSHHSQNHHEHSLHSLKKMKKEQEACKDERHVSA